MVYRGAIESSNKIVVQLRLKQAGMRWSADGATFMITLRCYHESEHWNKIEKIVVIYTNNYYSSINYLQKNLHPL